MQSFITPGTPQFKIVRPTNELEVFEVDLQSRFRSVVAMLLYMIKYSRSDVASVIGELSK
jgi:hypothetical protein